MRVVCALDDGEVVAGLIEEGAEIGAVVSETAPAHAAANPTAGAECAELLAELSRADILLVRARRSSLTAALVAACDRFGVRISAVAERGSERRLAEMFGVAVHAPGTAAAELLDTPQFRGSAQRDETGRIVAVWGPAGSPGRSLLATELASELGRQGRHAALVDADTHAAAVAILMGVEDDGPGFPAACRRAARGELTVAELVRMSIRVDEVDVLTGINRPSRWPELSRDRVAAALAVCREWAQDIIVDVSAPLEQDEEIVSDLDGPRRNAATLAVLADADLVVAVVAADPVGVSRFVRSYPELRAACGAAPIVVVANKVRASTLGVDPRAQLRRTLDRYSGIGTVSFLPWDPRATDAALLAGRSVAATAPRSGLSAAVRRLVGDALSPRPEEAPSRLRERRTRRAARAHAPAVRETVGT